MKHFLLSFLVIIFCASRIEAQSLSGNWDTSGNWTPSGVPADNAATSISLTGAGTLNGAHTHTIGAVAAGGNTFTIGGATAGAAGTLTIGSSSLFSGGTKKNLTFASAGGTLTIGQFGYLEIWGDLIVNNGFQLNVASGGTLIVHGNITDTGGGAQITVTGGGSITVTGNLSLSTGGQITGPAGSIHVGGTCTCSGCSTQCSNGVVPVKLVSFESILEKDIIVLKWSTFSELNFDYFSVEKSADGKKFFEIAQVKGHGTTNDPHYYQTEDKDPIIGFNYYRLTSVDFDNYKETFKVIANSYSASKNFVISPNPSNGSEITVSLNFDLPSEATITLFNHVGSVVGSFSVSQSQTTIKFANPLKSGVYIAKFSSLEFSQIARLLVQ